MIFLVFKHTTAIIIIIILNYRCYTQADILPIFSLLISKLKVLFFFFLPLCLEGSRTVAQEILSDKANTGRNKVEMFALFTAAVHREWAINHGQSQPGSHQTDSRQLVIDRGESIGQSVWRSCPFGLSSSSCSVICFEDDDDDDDCGDDEMLNDAILLQVLWWLWWWPLSDCFPAFQI